MGSFLFLLPFVVSTLQFSLSGFKFPHKISPVNTKVNLTSQLKIVGEEKTKRNATNEGGMNLSGKNIDFPSCPCGNDRCTCLESLKNSADDRNITNICIDSPSTRRKYCYEPLEVGPCPEGYRLELTEVQKVNEERNTTETVEDLRCKALPCPNGSEKLSDGTCAVKPNGEGHCPLGWYPLEDNSGIVGCECEFYRVYVPSDGQCHKLYTQGPCGEGKVLVVNGDRKTIECQKRTCPDEWAYWPDHERCYPLRQEGPCNGGIFMLDLTTLQPFCADPITALAFITAKDRPCQPGSFRDFNKQCRESFSWSD